MTPTGDLNTHSGDKHQPSAPAGARSGGTNNVVLWSLAQMGQFLALLGQMLLVGVVMAMVRRQFHWRAFFVGTVALWAGTWVAGGLAFVTAPSAGWGPDAQQAVLWVGVLGVAVLVGALVGRVGRRVGFWESYLAVLLVGIAVFVHLAVGFDQLLGLSSGGITGGFYDLAADISRGGRLLGPMWDRMVLLGALAAFLLAVFGGSLAFMFYGDTGRADFTFRTAWVMSGRYLSGRKRMGSLTAGVAVVGIALGVAALTVVTAVMSGYQEDIQTKILSTNAHLVVQKYGVDFTEYKEVGDKLVALPEVVAATPFAFNEAMLSAGDQAFGVLVKGIDPATAGDVTAIGANVCQRMDAAAGTCVTYGAAVGSGAGVEAQAAAQPASQRRAAENPLAAALAPRASGIPVMLVGLQLFNRLGVPVGTKLALTTPVGIAGARGNAPKRMVFELGGAFRSGMHEFDSRLIYVQLGPAQLLTGLGQAVSGVELRVAQPERVESVSKAVLSAVGRYPYRTIDWRELNIGIFMALKLLKIVTFLILASIVVVAAFNIASTLFMAVVEKAHDMAVLKSMGARDGTVMKIFVIQGWVTGGLGTAIGVALGLLLAALVSQLDIAIAADVYWVESLKVQVHWNEVLLTAFAALTIAHLATVYPALKAARQRPVDAMRYEELG